MKKYLLLLTALLPLVVSAEKVEINGIWYNLVSKAKTAEVTFKGDYSDSYDEYSGSIIIPATVTYNGVAYRVTSIGENTFNNCTDLTAITLSEGVTSIGSGAFYWCGSLTSITIPTSVTSLGLKAFGGCSSLISLTLPEGVTSIGNDAFEECTTLTTINIPKSLTSIRWGTFFNCI